MSTWMYIKCMDHDPQLRAEDESGQHHYDLPRIRAEIAENQSYDYWQAELERLQELWSTGGFGHLGSTYDSQQYFRMQSAKFLRYHAGCNLGIEDEYGVDHPLEES